MATKKLTTGITYNTKNKTVKVDNISSNTTVNRANLEKKYKISVQKITTTGPMTYTGTKAADQVTLQSSASRSKVTTGAGNDRVVNYAHRSTINAGDGNDFVANYSHNSIINGGAGNDTIKTLWSTSHCKIYSGNGNDYVSVIGGQYNSVSTGDGNDYLYYETSMNSKVSLGAGNDTAYITGSEPGISYTTHRARTDLGTGNDKATVRSTAYDTVIGGGGADRIYVDRSLRSKIYGGEGNDTLIGKDLRLTRLDGGIDNDKITLTGGNTNTISGGEGNDYIYLSSTKKDSIVAGDGNDTVKGLNIANDTIKTEAGADRVSIAGATSSKIYAGAGADRVTIKSGNKDYVSLYSGNDYFLGSSLSNSTVYGDSGTDTIKVTDAQKNKIYGGTGNDKLYIAGNDNSIASGTGNDYVSISGSSNRVIYTSGTDTIQGAGSNDSITLYTGVTVDSLWAEDNDLVVKTNKGTLKVIAVADSGFSLIDTSGNSVEYNRVFYPNVIVGTEDDDELIAQQPSSTVTALGGNDRVSVVNSDYSYVDLGSGNDVADLRSCSSSTTVIGGAGNDTLKVDGCRDIVYKYYGGNDVIQNESYNNLNGGNDDSYYKVAIEFEPGVKIIGRYMNGASELIVTDRGMITRLDDLRDTTGLTPVVTIASDNAETYQSYYEGFIGDSYTKGGDDLVLLNPGNIDDYQWGAGDGNDTIAGYEGAYGDTLQLYMGTITGEVEGLKTYTPDTELMLQKVLVDDFNTTLYIGKNNDVDNWNTITLLGVTAGSEIALYIDSQSIGNFTAGTYTINKTGTFTSSADPGLTPVYGASRF